MGELFKITQLAVYNPQRLDDKTLKALFIARTKIFEYLITSIKEEKNNSIPQHFLIIASRGMGKSMLLKRIEAELKSLSDNNPFIPILYPEEQYNIAHLNDLWLNSIDRVADMMDQEGKKDFVDEIDSKVETFQKEFAKLQESDDIFNYFIELTSRLNKRPVLLIDNINFVFERLPKDQQHKLRYILNKNNAPILIAASPVKVEQVLEYGAPFYDAFSIQYLEKLNDKELFQILNNLAKLIGSNKVPTEINKYSSRLLAINSLTGGSPRTTVMLFKLIIRGFSDDIIIDLDALLDEITPLYKARFEEELSDQQQQVLNAIALNWEPVGIKKIGELTGLENTKLSPQLLRLTKAGWLNKKDGYQTQGKVYEINERFFNIWYLMRQSSRRHKKQVGYLSKFLVSLYGDESHTGAKYLLNNRLDKPDHFVYNLAIADSLNDKDLKEQLIKHCRKQLNDSKHLDTTQKKEIDFILKQFEKGKETKEESLKKISAVDDKFDLFSEAYELNKRGKHQEAAAKYEQYLNYYPNDSIALNNLANLYKGHFNRLVEAEKLYKKAIEVDPNDSYPLNGLANLYVTHFSRFDEAEKLYNKAIEIEPINIFPLNGLANLFQVHLKRYKEAEELYKKAIKIDPKNSLPLNGLAYLYQNHFSRFIEAEEIYKKAIKIDPNNSSPVYGLATLLQYHFSRFNEAEELYKKAIKINPKNSFYLNGLANLYQDHLKRFNEAKELYKKALEIEPTNAISNFNLVFLLRDRLSKIDEAKVLFETIKKFEKVKDSYYLNIALFDLYESNQGLAKQNLKSALAQIESNFSYKTQDDWWRFAAVCNKLGYSQWLFEVLEDTGYDKILAPYYAANKALTIDKPESYLESKAVEIRDAAKIVLDKIKAFM